MPSQRMIRLRVLRGRDGGRNSATVWSLNLVLNIPALSLTSRLSKSNQTAIISSAFGHFSTVAVVAPNLGLPSHYFPKIGYPLIKMAFPFPSTSSQHWDAAAYAYNAHFVAALGQPVLDLLQPQSGERILDLGCGDGALTEKLVALGAQVVGIDNSQDMIAAALRRGLDEGNGCPCAGL
jgi:2-polyprenyl-3-methyl-5-hydroxy-6-metoxy-1,4-benzoquinol methylase